MNQNEIDKFNQCIEILKAGGSLEHCIHQVADISPELLANLKMASETLDLGEARDPKAAMENSLARVLSSIAGYQLEDEDQIDEQRSLFMKIKRAIPTLTSLRPLARRMAWVMVITVMLIALSGGLLITSAKSIPGDSLYPVKRVVEDIQFYLNTNPQNRLTVEEDFNQKRVGEIIRLIALDRVQKISFEGVLEAKNNSRWTVNGIQINILPDTVFVNGLAGKQEFSAGALVEIEGSTNARGSVDASEIHLRQYQFEGIVEKISPSAWQVSGYKIPIDSATNIESGIIVGDEVLILIRSEDDSFFALSIQSKGDGTPQPTDPLPQLTPPMPKEDPEDLLPGDQHESGNIGNDEPAGETQNHDSQESTLTPQVTNEGEHISTPVPISTDDAEHDDHLGTPEHDSPPVTSEPHE